MFKPGRLRTYIAAEEPLTQLVVVDTAVEMLGSGAELLKAKALRLKVALIALAGGAVSLGVGILVR